MAAACLAVMIAGAAWPFIIGVLAPVLREDLNFSAGALGVSYAAYYLVASLSSRRAGDLIDRRPVRSSAWLLVGLCSLQLLVLATASTWTQMLISGLVGGLCLGLTNPVTNAAIAATLSGRRARWVIGVKQAGVPIAAALSGLVLPAIERSAGWRVAVLATLALPVVALATSVMLRGGPGASRPSDDAHRLGLEVYALLLGVVAAGLNGYMALFVVDSLEGSVQRAGALMAAFAIAGAVGRMLWSAVGGDGRTLPLLRGLAVAGGVALVGMALPVPEWSVWVAVVLAGVTVMAWQGLGMLAAVERSGGAVGGASGRLLRMFYGGFVIGSPLSGLTIDTVGFHWTWAGLAVLAVVAAASVRAPASRG